MSTSMVEVSGPGVEGKRLPSLGAALSYAQKANRDGVTFYVRAGTETWAVERRDRITLTYLVRGGADEQMAKPGAAPLVTLS
jgi:hypothetical protein